MNNFTTIQVLCHNAGWITASARPLPVRSIKCSEIESSSYIPNSDSQALSSDSSSILRLVVFFFSLFFTGILLASSIVPQTEGLHTFQGMTLYVPQTTRLTRRVVSPSRHVWYTSAFRLLLVLSSQQGVTLCVPLNNLPWWQVVSPPRPLSPRKLKAAESFLCKMAISCM